MAKEKRVLTEVEIKVIRRKKGVETEEKVRVKRMMTLKELNSLVFK
jgi:hypothetical protein